MFKMVQITNLIMLTVTTLAYADIFIIQQRPVHEVISEIRDLPARFGDSIPFEGFKGHLAIANPIDACSPIQPAPMINDNDYINNWFVIVQRYNCSFELKVRNAQSANFDAVIVYNVNSSDLETMSAKNPAGIIIPSVFVGDEDGYILKDYARNDLNDTSYYVVITSDIPFNISTHLLAPFAIVVGICFLAMLIFMVIKCIKDRRRQRRYRLPKSSLNKIPTCKFVKGAPYDTCAICLDDFIEGEKLRVLPCAHAYHCKCIDPWLTKNRRVCPICKRKVFAHDERPEPDSESDSEVDDTMPLINPSNSATRGGGTFASQRENPFQRARRLFLEHQQNRNNNVSVPVSSETDSRQSDLESSPETHDVFHTPETASQSSVEFDNNTQQASSLTQRSSFGNFFKRAFRSVSQISTAANSDGHAFATSSDYHSINHSVNADLEPSEPSVEPSDAVLANNNNNNNQHSGNQHDDHNCIV